MAPGSFFHSKVCHDLWETFLDAWSPPEEGNMQLLLPEGGNSPLCQGQSHFPASLLVPWAWNLIPFHCAFKRRVPTRPWIPWHPRFSKFEIGVEPSPIKKLSLKKKNLYFLKLQHGLRDLSSPTRHWTGAEAVKALSPDHCTIREFPKSLFFNLHSRSLFVFSKLSEEPKRCEMRFFGVNSEDGHLAHHNIISH